MASFRGNVESSSVLRCVNLLVNKVAVLVSHVKSTNALREPNLYTIQLQRGLCKHAAVLRRCITQQYTGHA